MKVGAYRLDDNIAIGDGLRRVTSFENAEGKAGYTIAHYEIEGTGIGHSFGLDWKFSGKLNFGFRYDMEVDIDVENSVRGDDNSGKAVDGDEYSEDLPAVCNAGTKYQLSDAITMVGVFNYYFQKGVDMMGGTAVTDKWEDAYDIGIGLSYKLSDAFELITGINYSDVGIPSDAYTLIHALTTADNAQLGIGLEYSGFSKTKIFVGLGSCFYTDERTPSDPFGDHERTPDYTYALGFGIEYKL